ncbi:hypothetical protein KIW84_022284 [Lathyrus oleraceus]|uniref:Uncharacterized protein n=1 Tax=Pisum sativum TaxID=3888 RepID=A0A9D5BAJ9_PEA|nr:hypothetical protein KIW84_022284 [Pisum sativum]
MPNFKNDVAMMITSILNEGKTLEELRSSLYNELRTSEGAKRQQQRYCGLVVALSFNFMVAVGIIMDNKLVLALAAVSAGVAVATVSDLEFNLFGAIVAVIEKLTSFDFFSLLLLSPNPTHRYSGKMAKLN